MEDRLEQFIRDNRENFDFREPDPAIWQRLEMHTHGQKKFTRMLFTRRAAMILLLLAASYGAFDFIRDISRPAMERVSEANKTGSVPSLTETEKFYSGVVDQKMNELKPILASCPSLAEELDFDMAELDRVYSVLKSDLKDNVANQEVIEAIIDNYRLKIAILEDLLSEIDPEADECLAQTENHAL